MKIKNLIKGLMLTIVLALIVTTLSGCSLEQKLEEQIKNVVTNEEEKTKQNDLVAFEYIEKIKPEFTVEEINKVIGSEGELTDEKYNKYTWKITDNVEITATYYSSKTATIKIEIDKKLLKDSKADLSCAQEIKSKINSKDGIKYDEFVNKIGTNGYLIEKSSSSVKYIWVDNNVGYIEGSFSSSSKKCTFFYGWTY